jgi:predicted N-acyltransferase
VRPAALGDLARQEGVKWFAFLNVDGGTPVAHDLEAAGLTRIPMNTRFRVDVGAYSDIEEFVAAITSKKARFRLRQNRREAERLGLEVSHPAPADAEAAIELCRRTTARHGTAGYYPEGFHEFVRLAAEVVQVSEVRLAGQLAAAAVCLRDRTRFHLWAGGIDYEVTAGLHNAFPLLLWPTIARALALDARVFEGGRGNQAIKLRYRLSPVPLFAFVGST